ncbi:hypothetical protein B0H14DRAFT_2555785 [Mycena olivaceomarginata]|nr:hypothetical protein B0H14DRAFT_2555785 [Mycena olivaceomarginata]
MTVCLYGVRVPGGRTMGWALALGIVVGGGCRKQVRLSLQCRLEKRKRETAPAKSAAEREDECCGQAAQLWGRMEKRENCRPEIEKCRPETERSHRLIGDGDTASPHNTTVIDACSHQLRVLPSTIQLIAQPKTSCGQVSPLISHPSMHTVPTRDEDTGDDAEIARILGELELQDTCTRFSPSRPPYPRPPPCSPSPPSAAPPPYSSGHSFSTAQQHQDSRALLPATPTRITYHYRTPTSQGDTTEWSTAGAATQGVPGLKPKLSSAGCPIAFSMATRRSPLHTPPSTTPTDDCGLARLTMPVGNLSLPLPCPYPSQTRTLSIRSIAPKRTMTLASNANSIHSVSAIPHTSVVGKASALERSRFRTWFKFQYCTQHLFGTIFSSKNLERSNSVI